MAVNIPAFTAESLAVKLGDPEILDLAHQKGVTIGTSPSGITIKKADGTQIVIPAKATSMLQLASSSAPPILKQALHSNIKKMLAQLDDAPKTEQVKTTPIKPAEAKAEPIAVEQAIPTGLMAPNGQKMPKCKLSEAKGMYQPVEGTSPNSTYFVVGLADNLKVAARYTGAQVSVRVEGPGLKAFKDTLKAAGFDYHPDTHASIHVVVNNGDTVMASKVIGSTLCSMGVQFNTPMPVLSMMKAA